ncbi:hypothetical protein Sme01_23400 [Sphaerisporangium melleum]|uniref:ATP-grasp-modified RiPP n=1 Tax=Sphaerisporangium melleum TaxID=321316 RepID=A0A917VWD0_9ACTN|nr:putative ATP-grasp-modified RiPP [Sphaerisporangium melleum]GGL20907.1 hypothetical protein GCM10007964_73560 [Sphaerisporangium melleum]GII69864.1 hypothetical protein Sme01_23400 [Sphaerisporangium melleum]
MNTLPEQPWGLTRTAPFVSSPAPPYRVELDSVRQTGVYRDATTGRLIEAGKHGTSKQTSKTQRTGGSGDGRDPQPSDQTTVTDYDND